ncbi:mucin-2-like [Anopheles bellator]|uniref:mucin-2-like n=1 Tax=Anopheles bellator TaxID=139047 RepID=UPI002648F66F|nr:mucin-2-like [Anopheles bellator]
MARCAVAVVFLTTLSVVLVSGQGILDPRCPLVDLDPNNPTQLPHATDCTLFYTCSWGYAFLKQCPTGQYFGAQIQRCDHPVIAQCTLGGTTAIPNPTTTTVPVVTTVPSVTTVATVPTVSPTVNPGVTTTVPGGTTLTTAPTAPTASIPTAQTAGPPTTTVSGATTDSTIGITNTTIPTVPTAEIPTVPTVAF